MSPALLPVALLFAAWPLSGEDPLAHSFPLEASGNIRFQADVVLFQEDGEIAPEVTIAIPADALATDDDSDSLHVRVSVALLDRSGNPRAQYQTDLALEADSTVGQTSTFPVPERWLRLHPRWFEGTRGIRIQVEDTTRLKVGLLDKLRGEHPAGQAQGRFDWPLVTGSLTPPDPAQVEPEDPGAYESEERASAESGRGLVPSDGSTPLVISGLLFAWSQAEGRPLPGPGLRSVRARLHPNPFRYYGLHQPVVTAYWERYGLPPGTSEGDALVLVHEIRAIADNALVTEIRSETTATLGARWELQRFDVSPLLSGGYRMEARIEDTAGRVLAATSGEFQVVWEQRRWTENEQTLLRYAELLLLDAVEHDSLLAMDRGQQEEFLRRFWDRLYPTTPGEPNEREMEFLRRIEYANKEFGSKYREGYRTDRGRVFIRIGPPDEITVNLNPQDRELLAYVLPEEIDDPGESLEARLRQTKRRSLRDNRAYEVWDYIFHGDPIVPEFVGMKQGLKFIFVDELGFGEYKLVYSNLPGNLR